MSGTTTRSFTTVVTVISVLIVGEASTFLIAALLHLGVPIPLGFPEPCIIPAAIAEGLCGLFLAVGAYGVFGSHHLGLGSGSGRPSLCGGRSSAWDHGARTSHGMRNEISSSKEEIKAHQ